MVCAPFEYIKVFSHNEAAHALADHGEDAKLLAGGQSLVPMLNLPASKVVVNLSAASHIPGIAPHRHALEVHRRLPCYQVTPLLHCPPLATALGVEQVWVKDESSRLGLPSFKMLGASYAAYRELCRLLGEEPKWSDLAELKGCLAPLGIVTLAAATDGNHGRAVARIAQLLGYPSRIYVPAGTVTARIDAIKSEGASVVIVDGDYDHAVRRCADEAGDGCMVICDMSWRGYEQIPSWVVDGYSTMFWEMKEQLAEAAAAPLDAVALPVGVGALASATVRHFRGRTDTAPVRLIGVEPAGSDCVLRSVRAGHPVIIPGPHTSIMAGLNCGTPSRLAWPLLERGLDVLVAIDDDFARAAMRMLARVGVVAGETGAAALGGLLALRDGSHPPHVARAAGLRPDARVLIICSEGPPGCMRRCSGWRSRFAGSGPRGACSFRIRGSGTTRCHRRRCGSSPRPSSRKGVPQADVERMISANPLDLLGAETEFAPAPEDLAWARGLVEDPCFGGQP